MVLSASPIAAWPFTAGLWRNQLIGSFIFGLCRLSGMPPSLIGGSNGFCGFA
jgi:hypothetical protein